MPRAKVIPFPVNTRKGPNGETLTAVAHLVLATVAVAGGELTRAELDIALAHGRHPNGLIWLWVRLQIRGAGFMLR